MNKCFRIAVNFLSLLILATAQGCATVGSDFHFRGTNSIIIGKTTQAEILARYGKPFRVGYENGDEKWTYGYYKYFLFSDSETKDLAITFNQKGTVANYTYSSSDPDEVSKASKR